MLKTFCYWPTSQAIDTRAVRANRHRPLRRWGLHAAFFFVSIPFLSAQEPSDLAHTEPLAVERRGGALKLAALVHDRTDGLSWFGARSEESSALVLSMDCPLCLDKLEELAALPPRVFTQNAHCPILYFRTNKTNRKLTVALVSAVLSQPNKERELFLAICHLFKVDKEAVLTNPDFVAQTLCTTFPESVLHEHDAAELLARQEAKLRRAGVRATPLLIESDGGSRIYFKLTEVFHTDKTLQGQAEPPASMK